MLGRDLPITGFPLSHVCSKKSCRSKGHLIRAYEVSMDATFHGDFLDTNGGRVRHWRSEILLFKCNVVLVPSGASGTSIQDVRGVYGRTFS